MSANRSTTLSMLPRWRLALASALAPACALANGGAADLTALPFEQLLTMEVFSASRFVQKTSEAPSSVTVISAAEIRNHGWRSLAEVARSVRGLYVNDDRNYSYLGARGFLRPGDYNTRFLLQVDGNRLNDAVYDQAPLGGEFPLELDLIERIEFVPGPGSSVYGSNAFFGVINVITKKPASLTGVHTVFEAGSAGARKASAGIGWRSGGTDVLIAASRHLSKGADLYYPEFDNPDQNNGIASGLDHEDGQRLFASAEHGALRLTLMHAKRTKGVPTGAFAQRFNDARSRTIDRQSYLNAAWSGAVGASEEVKARLFLGHYDSVGDYAVDDAALTLSHDGSKARWWGGEINLVSTRWGAHRIVAGLDFQRDYRLRQYSFEVAPFVSYLDTQHAGSRSGFYVQDEISLSDSVLLNIGLRHDHSSGSGGVSSPRGALIYALSAATTLKAIYGGAYRAPNSYEKHYAYPGPGGQIPHPELRNETIRSGELVLEQQLGASARLTANLFRTHVMGLITLYEVARQQTRFDNAARLRASGMELGYERNWRNGAALRSSYSWIRLANDSTAQDISAPARMGKFNLSMPLAGPAWRGAFEAQYTAMRRGPRGAAPAYLLANANLASSALLPGADLSLGISNLFNRRYADPGSYEHIQGTLAQNGRRFHARLGYVF